MESIQFKMGRQVDKIDEIIIIIKTQAIIAPNDSSKGVNVLPINNDGKYVNSSRPLLSWIRNELIETLCS